jgi:glycosyltransferase involved in cell wall biosynthesis
MVLLDLVNCRSGDSPTHYQKSLFPPELQHKIAVSFDGVETDLFRRRTDVPRRVGDRTISPSTRIVTYVSRGFESMRGFDISMRTAKRIYQEFPDVVFLVVGSDRICYGGNEKHIRHKTFREHVLAQDDYDLARFHFTRTIAVRNLVDLLCLSDLHIYLAVPFVLSWSLLDALACGCTVLAWNTAPVREAVTDESNGLLADFFDVDGLARRAVAVRRDPAAYSQLGERGMALIHERYALDVTLPHLIGWAREQHRGEPSLTGLRTICARIRGNREILWAGEEAFGTAHRRRCNATFACWQAGWTSRSISSRSSPGSQRAVGCGSTRPSASSPRTCSSVRAS